MEEKDQQVGIRCTDQQRTRWEEAAKADRRTLTDWIRIQLDDAADLQLTKTEKKTARKR